MAEEFSVRDGLAWLGITWEDYERVWDLLKGVHGGPLNAALLDARKAQGTNTTPTEVLEKHGIDPAHPMDAARRYLRDRSAYWDQAN